MRWFKTQKELLEFMGKNGEDRQLIQRMLQRQEIMKENGMYCFVKDYDRNIFEERIKELEEENKRLKEENNKLRDILGGIVCLIDKLED